MGIRQPKVHLSDNDKELLQLLAKLLLEHIERSDEGNLPLNAVALSDHEAFRLAELLTTLIESREFVEGAFFVERLSHPEGRSDKGIREIYLKNRKKHGESRIMSSTKWDDFLRRVGVRSTWHPNVSSRPMPDEYFLEMERRLFAATEIHPSVQEVLLSLVKAQMGKINEARTGTRVIPLGTIRSTVSSPFQELTRTTRRIHSLISPTKIAAAMVLISNISVLFTSRDWSATGTLSGMGGAFVAMTVGDDSR